MQNILRGVTIGISTVLSIIFVIAAYRTLLIIIPVMFWTGLGILSATGLIWIVAYFHAKYIQIKIAQVKLDTKFDRRLYQQALMMATVAQTNEGLIFPNQLGKVQLSAFPKPVIETGPSQEPLILPEPIQELPKIVRLEDVMPPMPTIKNLSLGMTFNNEIISDALKSLSHIGIGGTSRWGKSVFLQTLLYQILAGQENTQLYLSDISGTSFVDFGLGFADDVASTEKLVNNLWDETMKRKQLFQSTGEGIRSLDIYNTRTGQNMPYCVFLADETTVLMSHSKQITQTLMDLVTYAGKYGVMLILAGQDWKVSHVPSTIRNQFSSRFQFKAMDKAQGRILIPDTQAHEIQTKGECYAYLPERGIIQMQTPFITEEMMRSVNKPTTSTKPLIIQAATPTEQAIINHYETGNGLKDCYRLWYELKNGGKQPKSIGGKQTQIIKDILAKHGVIEV